MKKFGNSKKENLNSTQCSCCISHRRKKSPTSSVLTASREEATATGTLFLPSGEDPALLSPTVCLERPMRVLGGGGSPESGMFAGGRQKEQAV